jgi:hypothetical protein
MGNIHGSGNWLLDTDDKTLRAWTQITRKRSPSQKVRQVFEMCEMMDGLQRADVRRTHPEADEREVFLRVAERRLGPEIVSKVYGWPRRIGK